MPKGGGLHVFVVNKLLLLLLVVRLVHGFSICSVLCCVGLV